MYNSYNSLRDNIQKDIENQKSVLNKFPEHISRPITQSCSKYLSQFTSFNYHLKSDSSNPSSSSNTTSTSSSQKQAQSSNNPQQTSSLSTNSNNNSNLINNQNLANNNSSSNSSNTGSNLTDSNSEKLNIIQLETAEQVNWTLENLMYGLTLSLEYQDIIKDCWNVYHDWLSVLLDEPKQFVPQPIKDDPINYSKKMLWHVYHLFISRKESQQLKTSDLTKHIMMCHGVLILIESIAKDSKLMQRDLWEEFLKFFLAINDAVLSPPFNREDFSEVLSSRIVATLFEIWLLACNKVFPSPSLWKSFQEFCSNWRHHVALVTEWNKVCFALTNRLLELIWWPESMSYCKTVITNDTNVAYDIHGIINSMNTETVIQAWFRFMHIVGKPIDFCDTTSISKSLEISRINRNAPLNNKDAFETFSINANFTCIKKLPVIFLECLKGNLSFENFNTIS